MGMHIYRFQDKIAVNPPNGDTFYLSQGQAEQVFKAMQEITEDLEAGIRFVDCETGTTEIKTTGSRYD